MLPPLREGGKGAKPWPKKVLVFCTSTTTLLHRKPPHRLSRSAPKPRSPFATTGWQRGLTTQTENWSGGVRKKWTTLQWTQDNTGVVYRLNPRVTETNVYDDADNRRRMKMSYTSFGLVSDVNEYDANATTVLRRTHTDYNLSAVYTRPADHRIAQRGVSLRRQ